MLALEFQTPTGQPLTAFDFGTVLPGTTSAPLAFRVANTGDTAIPAPLAWIEQVSTSDGAVQVTIGNVAVTGTSRQTATTLPALAVGTSLTASATFSVPAGATGLPVDTGLLRVEPI